VAPAPAADAAGDPASASDPAAGSRGSSTVGDARAPSAGEAERRTNTADPVAAPGARNAPARARLQ
jgi:hypothetical protein